MGESMDSDLSIRNDDKSKMQVAHLRSELEEQREEEEEESLSDVVVHKYKQKPLGQNYENPQPYEGKPREFSVTENYFLKPGAKTANQFSSPKSPQMIKSETMKEWKKSEYMSPARNSRCKLS